MSSISTFVSFFVSFSALLKFVSFGGGLFVSFGGGEETAMMEAAKKMVSKVSQWLGSATPAAPVTVLAKLKAC